MGKIRLTEQELNKIVMDAATHYINENKESLDEGFFDRFKGGMSALGKAGYNKTKNTATNAATKVGSAATNAATKVGSAATKAATKVGNKWKEGAQSAEQAAQIKKATTTYQKEYQKLVNCIQSFNAAEAAMKNLGQTVKKRPSSAAPRVQKPNTTSTSTQTTMNI